MPSGLPFLLKQTTWNNMPLNHLFTVVRNEAPFLLEWVAFHRLIGFDRIHVYSNNCDDRTPELLDELARLGLIAHVQHQPMGAAPQWHAAQIFTRARPFALGDYMMWADADEFLNIKLGNGTLADLQRWIDPTEGCPIPWRVFGDGNHRVHSGRQSGEAYVTASAWRPGTVRLAKTFFRITPGFVDMRIHAPLIDSANWKGRATFRSSSGGVLDMALPAYATWAAGGPLHLDAADVCYDHVQVNHYQVRSPAAFVMKFERGCGSGRGGPTDERRMRYSIDKYNGYNFNETEDRSILRHQAGLDAMIDQILGMGSVACIQKRIEDDFRAREVGILRQMDGQSEQVFDKH
ncbi:MAG: hypothetical protein ACI9KS_000347 [Sulfitobacter sp.]|jgi:hypothetical protein